MAKCEKREIPQPKPPVEYVLTMEPYEARQLMYVLVDVDIDTRNLREIYDALYDALERGK